MGKQPFFYWEPGILVGTWHLGAYSAYILLGKRLFDGQLASWWAPIVYFCAHMLLWWPPGIMVGTWHIFWRASDNYRGEHMAYLLVGIWHLWAQPALLLVGT